MVKLHVPANGSQARSKARKRPAKPTPKALREAAAVAKKTGKMVQVGPKTWVAGPPPAVGNEQTFSTPTGLKILQRTLLFDRAWFQNDGRLLLRLAASEAPQKFEEITLEMDDQDLFLLWKSIGKEVKRNLDRK